MGDNFCKVFSNTLDITFFEMCSLFKCQRLNVCIKHLNIIMVTTNANVMFKSKAGKEALKSTNKHCLK